MQELMYLLRVNDEGVQEELQDLLAATHPPHYVRLSTMAPLSNWGYPADAEGALLSVTEAGVVVGVEGETTAPRAFVPWQNIAYLAESGGLEARSDAEDPES